MTSETTAKKNTQKLQRAIVDGLEDVKAQDIVVFNTEHLSPLFERVVVASGTSNRQTKALAASVRDAVREAGFPKPRTEGEENGEWIIVDCGAAVVHVMQPAIRQYYRLEEIWGDTPVRLKHGAAKPEVVATPAAKKAAAKKAAAKSSVAAVPAKKVAATAARAAAAAKAAPGKAPSKAPVKTAGKPTATAAAKSRVKPGASSAPKTASKAAPKAAAKPAAKTTARPVAKAPSKSPAKAPMKVVKVNEPSKKAPAKTAASRSAPAQRSAAPKAAPARRAAAPAAKKTSAKTGQKPAKKSA